VDVGEFVPCADVDADRAEVDEHVRVLDLNGPRSEVDCELVRRVEGDDVGRLTDVDRLAVDGDLREAGAGRASRDEDFGVRVTDLEAELGEVRTRVSPARRRLLTGGRHRRARARAGQVREARVELISRAGDDVVDLAVNAVNLIRLSAETNELRVALDVRVSDFEEICGGAGGVDGRCDRVDLVD